MGERASGCFHAASAGEPALTPEPWISGTPVLIMAIETCPCQFPLQSQEQ